MAAIQINGIAIHTRIGMIDDFLRIHDFLIALLQEVTLHQTDTISRYKKHINIGIEQRRKSILDQDNLPLTSISRAFLITWQEHPDQTGSLLCSKQGTRGE